MQDGKDIGRELGRRLGEAERNLERVGQQLRALRSEGERVRAEEAQTIARLAKVRLAELDAERIVNGLDAADQEALAQLAARDREHERLRQSIDSGAQGLAERMAEHSQLVRERDEALARRDAQVRATMARLATIEDFQVQAAHALACVEQAQNAERKATQAEADRDHKRVPYEADKLFAYLWRRRYRFPEYRALPLLRVLDTWVAGLCNYDAAHRDYGMLLAIPERLRAHAEREQAAAAAEVDKRDSLTQAALAADGVPPLDEALRAAQNKVEDCEVRISTAERHQEALFVQQAEIAAGVDAHTIAATRALDAQLAREDVATLRMDAARTATPADDDLVQQIAGLRQRTEKLHEDLRVVEAAHAEAQNVRGNVKDLASRFRREGFDRADSLFDGLDLGWLLGRVLAGAMRSHDAWSVMRNRHRWRPSNTGSIFGGGGGGGGGFKIGGGGFGGGGFGTGGGFGGGGFRTGGGF